MEGAGKWVDNHSRTVRADTERILASSFFFSSRSRSGVQYAVLLFHLLRSDTL